MAARVGGGIYLAYCEPASTAGCANVGFWRVGAPTALTVPGSAFSLGKVLPERSGYYLGLRLVEEYLTERGAASTVRAAAAEFQQADGRALGIQTA